MPDIVCLTIERIDIINDPKDVEQQKLLRDASLIHVDIMMVAPIGSIPAEDKWVGISNLMQFVSNPVPLVSMRDGLTRYAIFNQGFCFSVTTLRIFVTIDDEKEQNMISAKAINVQKNITLGTMTGEWQQNSGSISYSMFNPCMYYLIYCTCTHLLSIRIPQIQ